MLIYEDAGVPADDIDELTVKIPEACRKDKPIA
jgi:hypothetical protein